MKNRKHHYKKQSLLSKIRRYARLAAVPHAANQYQPHLIRRYGLLTVLVAVVAIQFVFGSGPKAAVLGEKVDVSVQALLDQTNAARKKNGVAPLKVSTQLNHAASLKVQDMFSKQYWSHNAPDGTKPWKWLADVGYTYSEAGENLAKNFYTAESTMAAWMHSTEHRANILGSSYTEAGFAVATGELEGQPTTIIVALYGRPANQGLILAPTEVAGAEQKRLGILTRLGVGIQSMTPAALGSIAVLVSLMVIAFVAHIYRDYIPVTPHQPRHRHYHGAIKMGVILLCTLTMILIYGGGQI